jgi:hypothetical protein
LALQSLFDDIELTFRPDTWTYIWGNFNFSSAGAYKKLIGHKQVHPAFHWIWKSKCQMRLLLMDMIPTKDFLRRKNIQLDSYICDMCILQRPNKCSSRPAL